MATRLPVRGYSPSHRMVLLVAVLALAGCAKATVSPIARAPGPLPKPDMIVIHDFAVTPEEVKLDRGLAARVTRNVEGRTLSEEEVKIGHLVAEKLSTALVDELRRAGVWAVRAGSPYTPSATTAIVKGAFMTVDEGNQTKRMVVGFGMGASHLRTRILVIQGGQVVGEFETATKSSMKPGMLVGFGAGNAVGVVVGSATTGISEAFMSSIEADAQHTAQEVAKKTRHAYVERGWLAE